MGVKSSWFDKLTMTFHKLIMLIVTLSLSKGGADNDNHVMCPMSMISVVFLSGLFFSSPVFAQDFTISKFHSDITVNEDSSLAVTERIEVQFHAMKHGIYREIPYRYSDDRGDTIITPLDVLSVNDEAGSGWKYKVTRKGNVVNIRIGDPNKYVDGQKVYIISYTVDNAILFFNDHDELYWNVTGNYWWAPIKEASATVNLTIKPQSSSLWAACYTGAAGSKETACRYETSGNSGNFISVRNLNVREGLTIAFGWDKGLVSPPSAWKKFLWTINLRENWVFLTPLVSLIFMVSLWRSRGRDPKAKESVTVMYEPPKFNNSNLSPAEVGTLIDETLDPKDITSTIVNLAVKGYIQLEETKKEGLIFDSTDYYLKRLKGPDNNLSAFEKALMESIFTSGLPAPGRMVSEMKNEFYKHLGLLRKTLYGELVSMKYFLVSPDKVRKVYIFAGIVVMILGSFIMPLLADSPKGVIAGLLTGLPVLAFSKAMPAKTRAGAAAYMDILGFREFMSRAEKDRLERMGDKDLFSKFLPYAIALDIVDNWAKAFEGVYQEAPDWYVSHTGIRTFHPYNFSRSISSATSTMASAMYSAPRGSGGSGGGGFSGGSSGGGFGGGGGGSW